MDLLQWDARCSFVLSGVLSGLFDILSDALHPKARRAQARFYTLSLLAYVALLVSITKHCIHDSRERDIVVPLMLGGHLKINNSALAVAQFVTIVQFTAKNVFTHLRPCENAARFLVGHAASSMCVTCYVLAYMQGRWKRLYMW